MDRSGVVDAAPAAEGAGPLTDAEVAVLQKAAAADDSAAALKLYFHYITQRDEPSAKLWVEKAARRGSCGAIVAMKNFYFATESQEDKERLVYWQGEFDRNKCK